MSKEMTSYQVGVAAEAFASALFARCGFHVSVQYGANQPGYDLIVEKEKKAFLISVKGSQDGGWEPNSKPYKESKLCQGGRRLVSEAWRAYHLLLCSIRRCTGS